MKNKINSLDDLNGKLAVISGASSGIGKAIATKLAKHGCELVILDINNEAGIQTKKELSEYSKTEFLNVDVSSQEALLEIAEKIKPRKIDFLVNVAGISLFEKKGETSSTNFDKLIAVNMKSVYLTSMIFGHHLMNNGGSIVNVSSIRAKTGTPSFSSSYAAAKAGVENLSKSFALELADKNIRVNAIAPGATFPTKMSINWSEEIKTEITNTVPLKRLGSPEDMANGVYFLVSDLSTYITGQTLNINGGAWMG